MNAQANEYGGWGEQWTAKGGIHTQIFKAHWRLCPQWMWIVASHLLSISGSQFGSMHREGKDSLSEPQCTNFSLSPQPVGKWAGHNKRFSLACPSGISVGDRGTRWHWGSQHQSLGVAVIEIRCWRMTSQGQQRKPTFEDNSSHCPYGRSSERSSLPEPQAGLSDSQGSKEPFQGHTQQAAPSRCCLHTHPCNQF